MIIETIDISQNLALDIQIIAQFVKEKAKSEYISRTLVTIRKYDNTIN